MGLICRRQKANGLYFEPLRRQQEHFRCSLHRALCPVVSRITRRPYGNPAHPRLKTSHPQSVPPFQWIFPIPFVTLNVDGGVTNNDPFNYAHDYLASIDPPAPDKQLETDPCRADRAVLSIAPFPTMESYAVNYDALANSSVSLALPRLFSALVSQSRFFGESLSHLMRARHSATLLWRRPTMSSSNHTRRPPQRTSRCRKHCSVLLLVHSVDSSNVVFALTTMRLDDGIAKKFLRDHFVLPSDNVIMREALATLAPDVRENIVNKFRRNAPEGPDGKPLAYPPDSCVTVDTVWLPIIPLCTPKLREPIAPIPRVQMEGPSLDHVVGLISKRFQAVVSVMLNSIHHLWLRLFLRPGPWFIAHLSRGMLKQALIKELGDAYRSG